ncbi:MAG: YajQ family cyclic di-GMP-binding protein [Flaviflexus sp.]|nr:YajQ family cyclic di-GMP-binding protein [Flaviflexus sp.]
MADSSFDIVSEYDRQEVDNAVNQTAKEINQRYDFKNVGARVELSGETITMAANSQERCLAVYDVLQTKLIRRGVSLKSVDVGEGEPVQSGKEYRLVARLKEGIEQAQAKKITKIIRDEGPKGVKAQIQGDAIRVSSKSRDNLQAVIALLKDADIDCALQFQNYR